MKLKVVIASVVVVGFIVFGSYSFLESNVEYTNIDGARAKMKKVQLKGTWNKEKPSAFDPATSTFTFYLVDEVGKECRVVLSGAAPNNFEIATAVVAKGKFVAGDDAFHASEVLTKCPSKYEATGAEVQKSL
jgi:cytochrome c-type biogenesis protein CcmE